MSIKILFWAAQDSLSIKNIVEDCLAFFQEPELKTEASWYSVKDDTKTMTARFLGDAQSFAPDWVICLNQLPNIPLTAFNAATCRFVIWYVDAPIYGFSIPQKVAHQIHYWIIDEDWRSYLTEAGVPAERITYFPYSGNHYTFKPISSVQKDCQISFVGTVAMSGSNIRQLLCQSLGQSIGETFYQQLVQAALVAHPKPIHQIISALEAQFNVSLQSNNSNLFLHQVHRELKALKRLKFLNVVADLGLEFYGQLYLGETPDSYPEIKACFSGNLPYDETLNAFYNRSKICININPIYVQNGIITREFDILASGSFLLTEYRPVLEKYFQIGKEIETFRSPEELREKAVYYLAHEHARETIAQKGWERFHKEHTYDARKNSLVELVF